MRVRPMPPLPCQTPDLPHWHLPLNGLFAESGAAARRRRSVRGGSDLPGPSVVARGPGRARVASAAGGFLHHVHTWCCSSPATQALSDCQQLYRGRHSVERRRRSRGWNLTRNPSLAPVSQPAGGISGGPSPNAGTQVPNEILAFLISAAIIFMLMIGRLQRRQRRRQEKTLAGLKR